MIEYMDKTYNYNFRNILRVLFNANNERLDEMVIVSRFDALRIL
jgi:hypothetical protein